MRQPVKFAYKIHKSINARQHMQNDSIKSNALELDSCKRVKNIGWYRMNIYEESVHDFEGERGGPNST